MKKTLIFITSILFVIFISACSSQQSSENMEKEEILERDIEEKVEIEPVKEDNAVEETTEEQTDIVMAGQNGIISKDVYLALGEDKINLDTLMDHVTSQDVNSVIEMELNGEIIILPANTPITVLENDFASVKIKVSETSEIGWVPYEYVTTGNIE